MNSGTHKTLKVGSFRPPIRGNGYRSFHLLLRMEWLSDIRLVRGPRKSTGFELTGREIYELLTLGTFVRPLKFV